MEISFGECSMLTPRRLRDRTTESESGVSAFLLLCFNVQRVRAGGVPQRHPNVNVQRRSTNVRKGCLDRVRPMQSHQHAADLEATLISVMFLHPPDRPPRPTTSTDRDDSPVDTRTGLPSRSPPPDFELSAKRRTLWPLGTKYAPRGCVSGDL